MSGVLSSVGVAQTPPPIPVMSRRRSPSLAIPRPLSESSFLTLHPPWPHLQPPVCRHGLHLFLGEVEPATPLHLQATRPQPPQAKASWCLWLPCCQKHPISEVRMCVCMCVCVYDVYVCLYVCFCVYYLHCMECESVCVCM